MSRYAFRYLSGSSSIHLLLVAIVTCASTALTTRGDERTAKPADANVAKAGTSQPAPSSAAAEKATKAHIQQLIQDVADG